MRKTMATLIYAWVIWLQPCPYLHAATSRLTVIEKVYTLPGLKQVDSGWSKPPVAYPDKFDLYASAKMYGNYDHGCKTEGLSIGGYHTYEGYDPEYVMHRLTWANTDWPIWSHSQVEGASQRRRVRAQMTEAWGTLVCRGDVAALPALEVSLCSIAQGPDLNLPQCATIDITGEVREVTHVDVVDALEITTTKGHATLVSGPGLTSTTLTSGGGADRVILTREGGSNGETIELPYDARTGVVSWNLSSAKAGRYKGSATIKLDYP